MPKDKTVDRKQIKDLMIALKDMEPMVKNPKFLWNGRDMPNFSLRPREAWANWLICAVLQYLHGDRITFAEDNDGDGIILDKVTGVWIPTEHVSALDTHSGSKLSNGETRIINAIMIKVDKGPEYAKGKNLIVFFDGAGVWYRNKVREAINGKHNFNMIYAVGLLESGKNGYSYSVTEFHEKD